MKQLQKLCITLALFAFVVGLGNDVIESQINGTFKGFRHGNVYELMNGQAWQQIDQTYNNNDIYVPRVIIFERNSYFYMKVDGMSEIVTVQQIR